MTILVKYLNGATPALLSATLIGAILIHNKCHTLVGQAVAAPVPAPARCAIIGVPTGRMKHAVRHSHIPSVPSVEEYLIDDNAAMTKLPNLTVNLSN